MYSWERWSIKSSFAKSVLETLNPLITVIAKNVIQLKTQLKLLKSLMIVGIVTTSDHLW
jgi:hypothetical protein